MSDATSRGAVPTERDLPPARVPGAWTGSPSGAGESGETRSDSSAAPGEDPGPSGGSGTAARADATGTETPPRALPDDEP